jgi:hypothetical protein
VGKHTPLPADPKARKHEQWLRRLRCTVKSKDKRTMREYYAGLHPTNAKNLDLIGL